MGGMGERTAQSFIAFFDNSFASVLLLSRYRLIARVFCESQKMYILKVMDHREYDKMRWVKECECHDRKPPQKPDKKSSERRKLQER